MLKPEEVPLRHRDLNWLSFNYRVLQEAKDPRNPLYERLKFLAIFSTNLDEYFRVRVSQLRQIKRIRKSIRKQLALRPSKIVKEILAKVKDQQQEFGRIFYDTIIPELEQNGIYLVKERNYTSSQKRFASGYFDTAAKHIEIKMTSTTKEEELFLENNVLYLLITFKEHDGFGVVNLPVEHCGRFITLRSDKEKYQITFLDDLIKSQLPRLFSSQGDIEGIYEIKLSRDAELYIDDELEGFLAEKIYESLEQRTEGQPTRLLYDATMPKPVQKKLRKLLGLGKIDMMPGGEYHNFSDFLSFPDPTENPNLHFKELKPIEHRILEKTSNYFEEIAKKDLSLHFPYMSFSYVERFLAQAAQDEQVEQIKISIYRIADESILTSNLLKALERGKKVTVFIEAKARFDEKNNIDWGRKFEEKGATVIYSYPKIKVHSKILLIKRREGDKLKRYAYIGTGNFNSKTSKIYCDHAIFTAHAKLTKEVSRIFKVLEGDLIIPRTKRLLVSPFTTRKAFSDMIRREIDHAVMGRKAGITAKMNSLEDPEIIALLYEASNAGVRIRLLVRGFTSLLPGIKGLSENIYITSIVDRYLEHGRMYLFENNGKQELYFGSADWMTRNLDRRVEVIAPVYDEEVATEFKKILQLQLQDNVKARIQDAEEQNQYVQKGKGEPEVRSQYDIHEYLRQKHSL